MSSEVSHLWHNAVFDENHIRKSGERMAKTSLMADPARRTRRPCPVRVTAAIAAHPPEVHAHIGPGFCVLFCAD